MATQNELIYSIKEFMKNHTDDTLLANDHIYFQIKSFRSTLLRQLYSDRAKAFDDSAKQSFCLSMKAVDRGLCGADVGCTIIRSIEKIPSLLSVKGRSTLISVGPPIIGATPYELIKASELNGALGDQYGDHFAFIQDDYIYLVGRLPSVELIQCVSVVGIFGDPQELENYNTCSSCTGDTEVQCYNADMKFPMPSFLSTPLIAGVLKEYKGVDVLEERRDINNNSVPE